MRIAIAAAVTLALSAPAQAGMFLGYFDTLRYVGPTQGVAAEDGAPLSLCARVTRQDFLWLPVYYEAEFVFAADDCKAERMTTMTLEQYANVKRLGWVPEDAPDAPGLTPLERITPYFWLAGLIGALALYSVRRYRNAGPDGLPLR